jgi:cyclopropane fatty-acyl-phospholipid synthase-like methyltransferase
VLLRLVEAGVEADGLDLYEPMIRRLHEKARIRGLKTDARVADMRDFTMPRRYARVISAFNAFAHCATTEDQVRCLLCCREHLEPGGAMILHMSYPGPGYWMQPDGEPVLELEVPHPTPGHTLQLWDHRFKDVTAQRQRSELEVRELADDGRVVAQHEFETFQRWVYRFELELLFQRAGFSRSEILGGFEGQPLSHPEDQMVAVAWKD